MHVELVRTVTRDGLRLDGALHLPLSLGEGRGEGLPTRAAPRLAGKTKHPHPNPLPKGEGTAALPLPLGEGRGEGKALAAKPEYPHPNPLPEGEGTRQAALLLHGVAGNFYTSSTFEALIPRLQALGLAVLAANTRGHDSVFGALVGNVRTRLGAAYETVDDCRLDVAAWIERLKELGYDAVVLIGHSLGAIKALYGMAHEKWPSVTSVVAVSPPRLSCSAFQNAPDSSSLFFESLSTAERMVAEGQGQELFTSKFPFPLLITAAGYIDKYGPAERYNILRFVHDVPCPALFVYGSKELAGGGIAFDGLPDALQSLQSSNRRQVTVIEGADHIYTGLGEPLAETIAGWLSRTGR